jgi:CheY-like chemotaxis protein
MAVGYLLSDDLLFTSRIVGTGQALGLTVRPARTVAALRTLVAEARPDGVLLDLQLAGPEIDELLRWLSEQPGGRPRVVAYGSHVDTATLKAARQAGCDLVLPRSQFVAELPARLADWLGGA